MAREGVVLFLGDPHGGDAMSDPIYIDAREKWNDTGLRLGKGRVYRFRSEGYWYDVKIRCDATGFKKASLRLFEGLRRRKHAKWFSLIGCLDKDEGRQIDIGRLIGRGQAYTAEGDGQLFCYANDVWFFYFNNHGQIQLIVEQQTNGEWTPVVPQ